MEVPDRGRLALLLTVVLLLPAAPGAVGSSSCALDVSGQLVVGDAGLVGVDGVSSATETIPTECQGEDFLLTGSNVGDDLDIDFLDANGDDLDEYENGAGDESGTIPSNAAEARITYWAGAAGTYRLQAPPPEAPIFEPGPNAVTEDTQLFLHSGPTGVGNADTLVGGSIMDTNPPTKAQPSVWYGVWAVGGTVADAQWTWAPEDGFDLTGVSVDVSFFTAHAGQSILGETYHVELHVDGQIVAGEDEEIRNGGALGDTSEVTHTFGPLDLTGQELTLLVDPWFGIPDSGSAVLFDSVDFPAGLDIRHDKISKVVDVLDTAVGATHAGLSWAEATAVEGVDHYRVYRDDGTGPVQIAEPETTSFLDTGLSSGTLYDYQVAAVDRAGDEGPLSEVLTVETQPTDTEAPAFSSFSVDPGASVITVTWETDELTTGEATLAGKTVTTEAGFEHQAIFTNLVPGDDFSVDVTATDLSGNSIANTGLDVSTVTSQTFYLHNVGEDFREFMNEIDSAGDNDGRGWNMLGAALATFNHNTDTEVIAVRDVYPAESPPNPAVTLDTSESITGTIYAQFFTSAPPAGTVAERSAGVIELNLTLTANGGQLLGTQTVTEPIVLEGGWQAIEFDFEPLLSSVERGTLVADLRAEVANTAFVYGYEGDHASSISLPVQPGLPLQADLDGPIRTTEGTEVTFTAEAFGGDPGYTYDWDMGDGTTLTGDTVSHTYTELGPKTVTLTVDDGADSVQVTHRIQVLQRDFVNDERVVVAVIDTGINPYHPQYERPGATLPLSDLKNESGDTPVEPRPVALSDGRDYETLVKSYRFDRDSWRGIDDQELVWFEDTNVLGISFQTPAAEAVLDPHSHGTATSSTVLNQFPNAIIVMVQTNRGGSELGDAIAWAAEQSWIDVLSISWGSTANAPSIFGSSVPQSTFEAIQDGKVVVNSAGNDPSPLPTDSTDGPPWVLSVSGSQEGGESKEVLSSNWYHDYVSNYTVQAAAHQTTEEKYISISGTSFSAPTVAGTVAGIIHGLRADVGHLGGIEEDTQGVHELAPGYTNKDIRAALNRTATLPAWDGYVAGVHALGDHTHPPGAPWVTAGWGQVDASTIDPAVSALLAGTLDVPSDKEAASVYMQTGYDARWAWFG